MSQDISDILQSWNYDPRSNVRTIWGDDGVRKLQVRVDQGAFQGILQLNLDGRPDGKRPYGFDFVLDYYRSSLEKYRVKHGGGDEGFVLEPAACKELFDESSRVYGRYVFLLQLKDYERVVRDTERNMQLFRFVKCYAEREEDRSNLEKWRPYIVRIHGTAQAMRVFEQRRYDEALELVCQTRDRIDQLPEVQAEEFFVERERSRQALDELEEELRKKKPLSRIEQLERDLQQAIEGEEFEKAMLLRDQIKKLGAGDEGD